MLKKILCTIAILALSLSVVSCNTNRNGDDSNESQTTTTTASTEMTTATGVVYVPVTDASGNDVTDSDGNAVTTIQPVIITQIPGTTYVTVTDDKGEAVTDTNGEAVTSEQTIWVTTMQTVTVAPVETSEVTDTTKADTTTSTSRTTKATTSLTTTSSTVTTTTTADSSSSESENDTPSGESLAYGAVSAVVVDLVDTKEDGEFINLVFDVKDNASGVYKVDVHDVMIANIDLERCEFSTAGGCVSVGSPVQTDVPTGGTPIVYIGSAEGFAGEQIVVPVYIKNNSGVSAFDFKVEYDSTGLELKAIEKGDIINSPAWAWTTNTEYQPR